MGWIHPDGLNSASATTLQQPNPRRRIPCYLILPGSDLFDFALCRKIHAKTGLWACSRPLGEIDWLAMQVQYLLIRSHFQDLSSLCRSRTWIRNGLPVVVTQYPSSLMLNKSIVQFRTLASLTLVSSSSCTGHRISKPSQIPKRKQTSHIKKGLKLCVKCPCNGNLTLVFLVKLRLSLCRDVTTRGASQQLQTETYELKGSSKEAEHWRTTIFQSFFHSNQKTRTETETNN